MSKRILVVEDNPDNTKLIAWALEDEGYEFECVTTGEDAIHAMNKSKFDLILMDISLPGMDGLETTRRLRSDDRFSKLPIIAVTAHAIKGEDLRILDSGVSTISTKPIDEVALMATIEAYLAGGMPDV